MEKTIKPFLRNSRSRHMSDHIIQSDKHRDLDKHHQTSLERSLTIGLEDFHGFFREFLRIIFILFLDFL